ncbi:protein phosphatase 2A, regulatory subunit PR55 [Actinidia rufa]|uniref:Serine/threonine-protein phosphatase 2A 55 kDa regulatory subunit B n=1 Tax=Actinidia rufa TaxID=165716 RepID=A0A7J0H2Y5_9ERIC|nr:protein phosphatase 2A, regulatory subunit PR55 [Actinidia rufa]
MQQIQRCKHCYVSGSLPDCCGHVYVKLSNTLLHVQSLLAHGNGIDVISAIEFEKSGDYLAVGDRGGRVVIFERKANKDDLSEHYTQDELEQLDFLDAQHPQFQYKTEFQSHEPEVKEHKVKKVKEVNVNPFVLAENALLAERNFVSGQHKPSVGNGYCLEWTEKMANNTSPSHDGHAKVAIGDGAPVRCRKVYAHAHDFNINSISNNSDGETFVSADDLRVNLWNLEVIDQCFNIIDMKPTNMDDLTEVITSAEFHPLHCNLLAYSSSRGFIRLVDMRQSALCDHSARILQDGESRGSKSFFTEIIASISDIKFATDGIHILSRDYMNLKLWDTRMETSPVALYKIHEQLRPKLSDLYNNDAIFDKFGCCLSGDGLHFATGSYRRPHLQSVSRARRSSLSNLTRGFYRQGHGNPSSGNTEFSRDLNSKLLHVAWHPKTNLIACGTRNSLFLYYA